jgi:hypothetical protein
MEYKNIAEYTELDFVGEIVNYLDERLDKYDKYIRYTWRKVAIPFINSDECQINIDTSHKNEKEFERMMKTTSYYKQLCLSRRKYAKRFALLENELAKKSRMHAV